MLRLATLLVVFSSQVLGYSCPLIEFGVPVEWKFEEGRPVCLEIPVGSSRPQRLEVIALSSGSGQFCFHADVLQESEEMERLEECGSVSVTVKLLSADAPHTYVIYPSVGSGDFRLLAYEIADQPGMPHSSVASSPPSAPGMPPSGESGRCVLLTSQTLTTCRNELESFCDDGSEVVGREISCPCETQKEEFECLMANARTCSQSCRESLEELSECLYTPHLLIPMEIASMLLLATASTVLLCTLLRCCCRYLCLHASASRNSEDNSPIDELSDEEDADHLGSVAPLHAVINSTTHGGGDGGGASSRKGQDGSAHHGTELADGEEVDDDLPAYTEVVEGALVLPPRR